MARSSLRPTFIVTLAASSMALAGPDSPGTDWKTFNGTGCQSNVPVVYSQQGSICNQSKEQAVYVHCPITRDYSDSKEFPIYIRHSGRSGRKDEKLTCILRAMNTTGSTEDATIYGYYANLTSIANVGSASSTLFVNHVHTDLTKGGIGSIPFGALTLTCRLPASKIAPRPQCLGYSKG